jgi:hypothetical protein
MACLHSASERKDGVPVTASSLFAIAKISLVHTDTVVEGMGALREIASISRR